MGTHRNMAVSELNIRGMSLNTEAGNVSAVTIVPSDSGIMFINWETGNDCTYTLPAVASGAGKMFWFFNAQATKNLVVNAPTSTMVMENNATATTATSAALIGECAFVIGDGTDWYFFEMHGAWANA